MKITMFSFFKAIVYRLRSQHTSRLTLLDTLLAINWFPVDYQLIISRVSADYQFSISWLSVEYQQIIIWASADF